MKKYLEPTFYIDFNHPDIYELSQLLASGLSSEEEVAKNCFEWVRDNIKHSSDFKLNPVTCKASDVLKFRTGYCFAKSHLLAALLRANNLPAGLTHQRLSIDGKGQPFSLRGMNAVFLRDYGWYRIDARGNKKGVNAQFSPPNEQLAFSIRLDKEADFSEILAEPLPIVVATLSRFNTYDEFLLNLPDAEII